MSLLHPLHWYQVKTIIRQYNENDLFRYVCSERNPSRPTWVISGETLNEAMVPRKLDIFTIQTFLLVRKKR